jgi:alpha-mannosidase
MVQLGDFRFGANLAEHTLPRPLVLGWITNNYWETNFRAHQPGGVRARYWLLPHTGGFNEAAAHRFGMEVASPPILQSLGEPPATEAALPGESALLCLPEPPILILCIKEGQQSNSMLVTLVQAADTGGLAIITPGILRFRAAYHCDLLGNPRADLPLQDGAITLSLAAREIATVCLVGLEVGTIPG